MKKQQIVSQKQKEPLSLDFIDYIFYVLLLVLLLLFYIFYFIVGGVVELYFGIVVVTEKKPS